MQKLKSEIIDRWVEAHLTKAELDMLLYLARYQDERGRVFGVYYKKVCDAIHISYETFYAATNSLFDKGLISKRKAAYGDFDITIQNNDFSYAGAFQEGYLSVGNSWIFQSPEFSKLKAGEKLLAMQLLKKIKIQKANGRSYYLCSATGFFGHYARLFGVTKRTIRYYLQSLKRFFTVTRQDGSFVIRIKEEDSATTQKTDLDYLTEHLVGVAARRNRIKAYTKKQYADLKYLFNLYYSNQRIEDMPGKFLQAICNSIKLLNVGNRWKYRWIRSFKPALIHNLLLGRI